MAKKAIFLFVLFCGLWSAAQECPRLTNPSDGAVGVPVNTTITWPVVDGIIGYLITLGTTPGGSEILNQRSAGLRNFYTPELGLPEDTLIYVTISLFIADQPLKVCTVETFRTEEVTTPPECTALSSPANGETAVSTNTDISWDYAPKATGYRLSIGTASNSYNIVENLDVGNVLSFNPTGDLPLDTEIFVRITPYNENGTSQTCRESSFTTGISDTSCEAFFDSEMGEMVFPRPVIRFPDRVNICIGNAFTTVSTADEADGFRWYKIEENGAETLISEQNEAQITDAGRYKYEAYNLIDQAAGTVECSSSKEFLAVSSQRAVIRDILVNRTGDTRQITIQVAGSGIYEYALNNIDGPYQSSPVFERVSGGENTVYVRDLNGCGISQAEVPRELSADDFPKFFTPNGDGINDYWQFISRSDSSQRAPSYIHIFDRYGVFLAQILPSSKGWDGNFNGQPLPASSYWFVALSPDNRKINGYFVLKR